MRWRVASATSGRPLRALETVAAEQWATLAMFFIVVITL
jgi:hypothetical protein